MHITLICADDDIWALGMRSISAALKAAGHRTRMIFAGSTKASLDGSTLGTIGAFAQESDIIGISSMSRASGRAKAIIAGLRPFKKLIVWGGMHPTIYPEDCALHADLICRGEGEEFMIDLAERVSTGRSYADIPNGGHREDGGSQLNDLRPLIRDLDSLQFPDFSFEAEFVLDGKGQLLANARMREAASILFSGSRGCIYNCHYCSNSQLRAIYKGKGRYARKMSVPAFIAAAKECQQLFPRARHIYFTDEDFFARPLEEFREFADTYPAQGGLPFECMASPLQITEEKMGLLVRAGMWRVDVGVESGSDDTKRRILNRPVGNEVVMRAANAISRHPQVVVYYFFIIGNPYERRQDLLQTIGLLRQMPSPYFLRAYSLVFIPGTQLFNKACQDGIIAGMADSGYEIDFLGGLDCKGPDWKKKNLYLNSLIALMAGKSTRHRIGFLPRKLIPILTAPRAIDLCDRHSAIGESLIGLGRGGLRIRRAGLTLASRVLKNNRFAYDPKSLLRKRGRRDRERPTAED
jgi:anaerobic magnesium-protoporphyrin IX monomethyl ester cyclase